MKSRFCGPEDAIAEERAAHAWDAGLYDRRLGFVSRLGQDLVRLLDPQPGERILDLGCGTGDLTQRIAAAGAVPLGLDRSPAMIEEARRKHPRLRFLVADAAEFEEPEPFDAVFSNAALHWMREPGRVASAVWRALRPGGRFVAEFGGKGNAQAVVAGVAEALAPLGIDAHGRNPWYFPSLGEYCALLDSQGFRVVQAQHFERPTPLEDGEQGLSHWLDAFAGEFFDGLSEEQRAGAYRRTTEALRGRLFRDGAWRVDYVRLRVMALRP
jgi:trans-aconitate methyltransferase